MRAICFDLDDTLIDRWGSVRRFLVGQHARFATELNGIDLATYEEVFDRHDACGARKRIRVYRRVVRELQVPISAETLTMDYLRHAWCEVTLLADAEAVLRHFIERGWRLACITNGSTAIQEPKLHSTGLAGYFDTISISEREGVAKPDPVIFWQTLDRLGVEPADAVMVGDNPDADMRGAREAGLLGIWLRNQFPWPADLPWRPDAMIEELCELRTVLGEHPETGS